MITRSMVTKWAMTSTASATVLWVLAQRAIWFRLLPMRAICRVRSRSTAAAGAVHVRVRAMACSSSADSDAPAAAALACQSASSAGDTRAAAVTVRRSAIKRYTKTKPLKDVDIFCAPPGASRPFSSTR